MSRHITDEELLAAIANDPFHAGMAQAEQALLIMEAKSEFPEVLNTAIILAVDDYFQEQLHGEPIHDDWDEDTTEVPTKVWCRPVDLNPGKIVEMGPSEAEWFAGLSPMEAAWFAASVL